MRPAYEALPLEEAPLPYHLLAKENYERTELTVRAAIARGILDARHECPGAEWFEEQLIALDPFHEAMDRAGLSQDVFLVPRDLSQEQWDRLLAGHRLPDWTLSKGVARCYYADLLPDDVPTQHGGAWDVALMGATEDELSFKCEHSYFSWRDASLRDVLPRTTCPALLPSRDVYYAWQLARLQRADPPADRGTVTVSRHRLQARFSVRHRLCFSWLSEPSLMWDYDHHATVASPGLVISGWDIRSKGRTYRFRPTVCASEVTPVT